MAATEITTKKLTRNVLAAGETAQAFNATDGALVDYDCDDQKMLLVITNTTTGGGAATLDLVIKAGNGVGATVDYKEAIATATTKYIVIDSARFKNVSGTNKGKVKLMAYTQADTPVGSAGLSAQAFLLP